MPRNPSAKSFSCGQSLPASPRDVSGTNARCSCSPTLTPSFCSPLWGTRATARGPCAITRMDHPGPPRTGCAPMLAGARRSRRLGSWIATFAILVAALAPMLSQALADQTSPASWSAICTAQGEQWVRTDVGVPGDPAQGPASPADLLDHCPYCPLQGHLTPLPVASTGLRVPIPPAPRCRPRSCPRRGHCSPGSGPSHAPRHSPADALSAARAPARTTRSRIVRPAARRARRHGSSARPIHRAARCGTATLGVADGRPCPETEHTRLFPCPAPLS